MRVPLSIDSRNNAHTLSTVNLRFPTQLVKETPVLIVLRVEHIVAHLIRQPGLADLLFYV